MNKRALKRIAVILGVTFMLSALFGCGGNGKVKVADASGSCGENMTWEYEKKSQTLTITGSGEMVTTDRFMWSDYPIKNLVISEGVTTIDDEAFYSNHSLKGELHLPSTLKAIGEFAFYGCDGLTGPLELPDSVETVGGYAFERCEGFSSIKLSKSLKSVGDEAFEQLSSASGTLDIPDGLESLGRSVFYQCGALRGDVILPDSLKSVGTYAFSQFGCD